MIFRTFSCIAVVVAVSICFITSSTAQPLKVGAVRVDITPPKPVALDGQGHTRISTEVATPITANILLLEGSHGEENSAAAIVSLDILWIAEELKEAVGKSLAEKLPDFKIENVVLCATHTHTGPVTTEKYYIPDDVDCMTHREYVPFAAEKIAAGVEHAWKERVSVKFSYGLGHAVVAYNRRAVFDGERSIMYGNTADPSFRRIEGMEDHDVGTMFFWDENDKLRAIVVNVSCPSQEIETLSILHADYWHPTREGLKVKYGADVVIVPLCAASGDMSPHTMYRKAAEERMRNLRGLSRIDEIARRIVAAVGETYDPAFRDRKSDVTFRHNFSVISLPEHRFSEAELADLKKRYENYRARLKKEPGLFAVYDWTRWAFERQEREPADFEAPVHVLRIGDTVISTNPFELFTDYGVAIKARCKAGQTFVVQLASGTGWYLPTENALRHGGYGADPLSIIVGPEGGQMLVEESLKRANELFK